MVGEFVEVRIVQLELFAPRRVIDVRDRVELCLRKIQTLPIDLAILRRNAEGGLLKYALLTPTVDFDRLEEVMVITNARSLRPEAEPVKTEAAPAEKKS